VARVTGQIISMGLAIGDVSRLFTRALYADIDGAPSWNSRVTLSAASTQELRFWSRTARSQFTGTIFPSTDTGDAVRVRLASDASAIGWGGLRLDGPSAATAHGFFLPAEREQSSTHREARAALLLLQSFRHVCRDNKVLLQVDSMNLYRCVHRGSRRTSLCDILKDIFWLCMSAHILLQLVWVPRGENTDADELSKIEDRDDWCLNPRWFRECESRWGTHTVDRFASDLNAQCPRFFSRFHCPGCEGVDSFGYHWGRPGERNWINPPFGLIGRVLRKLRSDRATASVVIPVWPSRPWWHLVAPDGRHLTDQVVDWLDIPRSPDTFLPGRFSGNSQARGRPSWRVIVIRVDFSTGCCNSPLGHRCLDGGCATCRPGHRRH
jgi:hypothetical protein